MNTYCQQCPASGCSQDTVELCVECWGKIIETKTIPPWISKWVYKMREEYAGYRGEERKIKRRKPKP